MKRYAITQSIIFILLISTSVVNGQTEKVKIDQNNFGIVIGGSLSGISNYSGDSRVGFIGGVYWDWRFSEKLSLMANILYLERGATGFKSSYLGFPVVLKYNVTPKISLATGIAWDDLLAVNSVDYKYGEVNRFDWRIPFTAGYFITEKLAVGINYNIGLSDITPDDAVKMSNNWGSISLAYIFISKSKK